YALEMHKIAKQHSDNVYHCLVCANESLSTDCGSEYCYSCCSDFFGSRFLNCPYCNSERSMIYDALNIGVQLDRTIRALCLNCNSDDIVYHCDICGAVICLEASAGDGKCDFGFCEEEGTGEANR